LITIKNENNEEVMMKYSEYQPRPDLLKDRIILITGAGVLVVLLH